MRARVIGAKPKRSATDCQIQWEGIEMVNTEEWNEEELKQLKAIATRHHCFNWRKIASELGTGRAALDCLRQ